MDEADQVSSSFVRLAVIWLASSALLIVLSLPGMAYPFFAITVLSLVLTYWVSSESRWRSMLRIMGQRTVTAGTKWSPTFSRLVLLHGLVWFILGCLFFLFANYPVIEIFT